jgi:hypothetical protein
MPVAQKPKGNARCCHDPNITSSFTRQMQRSESNLCYHFSSFDTKIELSWRSDYSKKAGWCKNTTSAKAYANCKSGALLSRYSLFVSTIFDIPRARFTPVQDSGMWTIQPENPDRRLIQLRIGVQNLALLVTILVLYRSVRVLL